MTRRISHIFCNSVYPTSIFRQSIFVCSVGPIFKHSFYKKFEGFKICIKNLKVVTIFLNFCVL
jgi:hypothetical protein